MRFTELLKEKAAGYIERHDLKRRAADFGDEKVHKLVGLLASRVSDKTIPYLNRYDNEGFLEGDGRLLRAPAPGAKWSMGFAKASVVPSEYEGDLYVGGYLAFPPNKVSGFINEPQVRAFAFSDGSGRGVHVFAVIDCVGISNHDIRLIRTRLKKEIAEKNILSLNVSATHCHSGVDTQGVWGDLIEALKKNPKAVKKQKTVGDAVSGRNADFMDYLIETAAETVLAAVDNMTPGQLFCALPNASHFIRDKRPPYLVDETMTVLRFQPDDATRKTVFAVIFGAHPTNYGDKQRQVSADFPYYLCEALEEAGCDAAYFQSDELAVATDRGKFSKPGATRHEGIVHYGQALARFVLDLKEEDFSPVAPLLNVHLIETLIPVDNTLMALIGKLKLVSNNIVKVTNSDRKGDYDLYFPTEVGYAEFGEGLRLALIPGELAPELLLGGTHGEETSYHGTAFHKPPMKDAVSGRLSVIGLCNDAIAYIVPDNDFGSVFAPLHYEEAVSAGRRTASNVVGAFFRCVEEAEKMKVDGTDQRLPE